MPPSQVKSPEIETPHRSSSRFAPLGISTGDARISTCSPAARDHDGRAMKCSSPSMGAFAFGFHFIAGAGELRRAYDANISSLPISHNVSADALGRALRLCRAFSCSPASQAKLSRYRYALSGGCIIVTPLFLPVS